jgi:hypothetical protein
MKLLIVQLPSFSCYFIPQPAKVRQSCSATDLFAQNIPLRTPFSNTLSLSSSLNARDQVSHPYKTTGRIKVLYI